MTTFLPITVRPVSWLQEARRPTSHHDQVAAVADDIDHRIGVLREAGRGVLAGQVRRHHVVAPLAQLGRRRGRTALVWRRTLATQPTLAAGEGVTAGEHLHLETAAALPDHPTSGPLDVVPLGAEERTSE
jgi:hypothetical protein